MTRGDHQSGSRWATFVWPPWLPIRARLPVIAQIAGAAALIAAILMPRSSGVPEPAAPPASPPPAERTVPIEPPRPAHLNLDLRHQFRNVTLTVTVDDKQVLETKVEGGSKKFGMFGKRPERGFTRTLDLEPGTRVVRVRVRSPADKFDQSRVERFDLNASAVAAMRITAQPSGLSVETDKPAPAPAPAADPAPASPRPSPPVNAASTTTAVAILYDTLRSILIAVAGFIASAATGFVVQEYMRSRKAVAFADPEPHQRRTAVPE